MQKWVFGCVSLSFRHLHAYIYVTVCIYIKYLRAFFMARSGARIVFAQLGENNAFVFTRTPPQMHTHTHTKKKITHTKIKKTFNQPNKNCEKAKQAHKFVNTFGAARSGQWPVGGDVAPRPRGRKVCHSLVHIHIRFIGVNFSVGHSKGPNNSATVVS